MKTAPKALLSALFIAATTSACLAQSQPTPQTMTVTAGQGGYITLPDIRPYAQPYALTGDVRTTRQSSSVWQQTVGPLYRPGQSQLLLPASR